MQERFETFIIQNKYIKNKGSTTSHLLEWPKSITLTTSHTDMDVEQWEFSVIADGCEMISIS